jgi:REP element-mobilizing transposase RayT
MPFKPLNYFENVAVHRKNLPHWRQQGVTYFVTSRLADSLPAPVLNQWYQRRTAWLVSFGLKDPSGLASLPEEAQHEYHRLFTAHLHELLDNGYGSCCLKRARASELLANLLIRGHPTEYELDAWVIMPNHFHALVTPQDGFTLGKIVGGWKGSSSRGINLLNKRSGTLWQGEGFDHIVRSAAQFQHFRNYIADNPAKTCLSSGFVLGFGNEWGMSVEEMKARFTPLSQ